MKTGKFKLNKSALIAVLFLIPAVFLVHQFISLARLSDENINGRYENEVTRVAYEIDNYFGSSISALMFTADKVDAMLNDGESNESIGDYLIYMSETYAKIVRDNLTGIYGFVGGEYLDGSGWIPEPDYEPTKRPWYLSAINQDGGVVICDPYVNLQTFQTMTSVSRELNHKGNVLSLDLYLNGVQNIVQSGDTDKYQVFVISQDGILLAHTKPSMVGKNYLEDGDENTRELAAAALQDGLVRLNGKRIYTAPVDSKWKAVLVIDESEIAKETLSLYLVSILSILAVLIITAAITLYTYHRAEENKKLGQRIVALADIYVTTVRIDLKKDTIEIIRGNEYIRNLVGTDYTRFSERIGDFAERMTAEQSRDIVKEFLDLSTLEERMKGTQYLTCEFMDDRNRWIRMRLIKTTDRLNELIWTFESIDDDKKRQEQLRKRAENDALTGIRNRGSGEYLTRKAMADREKGMFCLMDVDRFKTINDGYGHGVGDAVLQSIAKSLRKTFRDEDIIFRLGGDEFAVFVNGVTDPEIADTIMRRLFKNIEAIDIPELKDRKVTVSVGASFYPANTSDSFEKLYKRADTGTYESKTHEGNWFSLTE